MTRSMEKRRFTYKECILILALLALAAALYLWSLLQPAGSTAIVEQNGTELYRISLSTLGEPVTLALDGVVIEITREGARFVSSPCPDQVCVEAVSYTHLDVYKRQVRMSSTFFMSSLTRLIT